MIKGKVDGKGRGMVKGKGKGMERGCDGEGGC